MSNPTLNIRASTQKFTEIVDIRENIVLLNGGNACLVIQLTATNFSLLSKEEQDARIISYASILNSLSFQIQIIIRSKKVQVTPYLKLLSDQTTKTNNTKLKSFIMQYKDFVENIVKEATVLDKQFYLTIPYSGLERGAVSTSIGLTSTKTSPSSLNDFFQEAKAGLHAKAESLVSQLDRLELRAHILEKEELVKLYYDVYNPENTGIEGDPQEFMKSLIVSEEKKV